MRLVQKIGQATRPRGLRCSTATCCRSAAFSASSRLADLKGEANRLRDRNSSATITPMVVRFCRQINTDEVFDTHTSAKLNYLLVYPDYTLAQCQLWKVSFSI